MRSTASIIRVIGFTLFGYLFVNYIGSTGDTSIFVEQPWLWAVLAVVVLIYMAIEISLGALENVLYRTLSAEAKEHYDQERAKAKANQFGWVKRTYKKLVGGKPIEKEGEIILDHNYDGIRELDNKLPPWWVYGFYATIIFAAIYLIRFELFKDYNQVDEYEAAVAQAKVEIEAYKKTAKDMVDVNTVQLLTEVSDLNSGKSIFEGNCVACHKASGGGGIGPNLTDDHWILGGGIKNVFNTISEGGRPGKGMIAWKADLKPSEMAQVASYVLSLHGSNPEDAKEAEGDIWLDPEAPVEAIEVEVIDSTKIRMIIEDQPVTGDVVNDSIQ
ncbi:cbb3-type cytochrome c oxidase N-terminal domain-containing protein [Altibacter sp. HG106]|uniref:cbb3-type cytochrome c oxidase N-terminal domain-containing protein n=1 Tax=Altibacter sp. HG106 TaxID=3023937 RepID=UPI00234FE3F4|nr:cbb3-type cytochrome c oxidase N-terminal domain-containing protein [Altibacter sp. HG106]MDC7994334.1 cbb3-type cytochrome c oxidase N-terminal domain-containing protein [Altibacter sp. HG106]